MPDESRIWIYAANRVLSHEEVGEITLMLNDFIQEWSSHGKNMDAAGAVLHDRFVIIAADESRALASGCGIDKSVRFMQDLGTRFSVDFFKRTLTHYIEDDQIHQKDLHEFWAMRKAGLIHDQTVIFDNTIKNIYQLKSSWQIPFRQSWHAEMWSR